MREKPWQTVEQTACTVNLRISTWPSDPAESKFAIARVRCAVEKSPAAEFFVVSDPANVA